MSTTRQVILDRQPVSAPTDDIAVNDPPMPLTHEEPTFEKIAAEAYAIYVANGAHHGRDLDDWLEAERRVAARHT